MILAPIVLASRPIEDIGERVGPTRFLAPYCLIGFAFPARARDGFFERGNRSLELPDESFQFARRMSAHQRGFATQRFVVFTLIAPELFEALQIFIVSSDRVRQPS